MRDNVLVVPSTAVTGCCRTRTVTHTPVGNLWDVFVNRAYIARVTWWQQRLVAVTGSFCGHKQEILRQVARQDGSELIPARPIRS